MARDNAWLDKKATYEPMLVECDIEGISIHWNRQVHYRIRHLGFEMDFFAFLRSDMKNLVVSGQDAVQRQRVALPFFYRWSWHQSIDASFITISDPTLDMADDLDAGWYQGYKEGWALDAIAQVIKRFAELLDVSTKDMLLYGISAGGFWALMSCTAFAGCKVMVEIPQVDIFSYSDTGPKAKMMRRCFKGRDDDYIRKNYSERLRVVDRWRAADTLPSCVLYYQNIKDYKHTRTQMEPFWDDVKTLATESARFSEMNIEFRMFNRLTEKGGHVPMERDETLAVWSALLA